MTQTTEQERAEFERTIGVDYDLTPSTIRQGQYAVPVTQAAWYGWQTARRAPAAPVPQETCVICGSDEPYTGTCGSNDPRALCKKPAPQPPEGLKRENPATKPEAAPVQLPEPQAEIEVRSMKTYLDLSIHEWRDTLPDGTYNIYTEQQVRELLAANGIKVAP